MLESVAAGVIRLPRLAHSGTEKGRNEDSILLCRDQILKLPSEVCGPKVLKSFLRMYIDVIAEATGH